MVVDFVFENLVVDYSVEYLFDFVVVDFVFVVVD